MMKRSILLVAALFFAAVGFAQEVEKKESGPVIQWDEKTYDFGEIEQGSTVEHTFKFTNVGTEPLIITNVQVTCGCTTPKGWPRDPIMPGGKSEITIAFNSAGKLHKQDKTVTIISNASGTNRVSFTTVVTAPKPQ
jgi:hypothetical protein